MRGIGSVGVLVLGAGCVIPGAATSDLDGDGHIAPFDCNDENPAIHPGAPESCDGVDRDCDGDPLQGPPGVWDDVRYVFTTELVGASEAFCPAGVLRPTDVCGDLTISPGTPEDLSFLSCVRRIDGDLVVQAPVDLSGMESLIAVDGVIFGVEGGPTRFVLPALESVFDIELRDLPDLVEIDLPLLERSLDSVSVRGAPALRSIALPSLTTVGVDLRFENVGAVDLVELSSLQSVGGHFLINGARDLGSPIAAPALRTVGGTLSVQGAVRLPLATLDFGALESVGGDLTLQGIGATTDIDLGSIQAIGGGLQVGGAEYLAALPDLPAVEELAHLILRQAPWARDFGDWSGLREVAGDLRLSQLERVPSISFPALESAGSLDAVVLDAEVVDLPRLATVDGAFRLRISGRARVVRLPALEDAHGPIEFGAARQLEELDLGSLRTLEGDLRLFGLDQLRSVSVSALEVLDGNLTIGALPGPAVALPRLREVSGHLSIAGVEAESVDLDALEHVGGTVTLQGNPHLRTLDTFSALRVVDGSLRIANNPVLSDMASAFGALERIWDDLSIVGNEQLPTSQAQALADAVVVSGSVTISGNGPD